MSENGNSLVTGRDFSNMETPARSEKIARTYAHFQKCYNSLLNSNTYLIISLKGNAT